MRGDHVIKQESYELIDIFPNNQTVAPVRFASHHYQCYHDIVHSLIASHNTLDLFNVVNKDAVCRCNKSSNCRLNYLIILLDVYC